MKNTNLSSLNLLTLLGDILIVCISTYLGLFVTNSIGNVGISNLAAINKSLPYICVCAFVLLYIYGLYNTLNKTVSEILLSIFIISFFVMVFTMALTFFLRGFAFPRTTIAFAALFDFILLAIWRLAMLKLVQRVHGKHSVIIIGRGEQVINSTKKILLTSSKLYMVKYIYDLAKGFEPLKDLINKVDHVFICSDISDEERAIIFSQCMAKKINVFIIPDLFDISIKNSKLVQFDDMPIFSINSVGITQEQKVVKRVFDFVFSIIAIILTSPIMLFISLAIKLTSPGPILFKQERVTENNRTYNVYKFRTMVKDAEKLTGPVLATDKDPRITKVGAFLRTTRLDELPQFFNVFLGQMSIVGPRPERQYFINQFKKELPEFEYRITVKAGITGLAQVMGKYTTTPEDKLRYDLLYIKNYSFALDLQLILQTIQIAFTKESSAGLKEDEIIDNLANDLGYQLVNRNNYIELINI